MLERLHEATRSLEFDPRDRIDWSQTLAGFESYGDFPNITRGLVARGYADEEIRKVLGENVLRVLDEVVAPATPQRKRPTDDCHRHHRPRPLDRRARATSGPPSATAR